MQSRPAELVKPSPPRRLEELAVFGGSPTFSSPLHVGRPNVGDRDRLLGLVNEAVDRRWLTNGGPLVHEFERRLAESIGVAHCLAVSSATLGIQVLAKALDLSGEVILPSFTFVGTAHALRWIGLTPVFCDIDRRLHTLDPDSVASAVTPRTSAILGVHLWGRPCEIDRLAEIADEHGVPLLFDAAHAFGCTYGGRPIGGFGRAEIFSFHATKVISTAEGGAITTNDDELADRLWLMRNFGFREYDSVVELGTNAKMSELSAAMGITSLEAVEQFVAINRLNHECYERELAGVAGAHLVKFPREERHNHHYVLIEVDPEHRDDLVAVLHAENVLARRYFHPGCHRSEPYRRSPQTVPLSVTEEVSSRIVVLPTGTSIDSSDIETICALVRLVTDSGAEVRRRLAALARARRGSR
jgi:dTDP-4-amino-4,6-dideoxygalactose transaminase